jgi:cytochrome c biogenesis protein CcmG/thiol:disulfide interchange protein DsbE
MKWRHVRLIAAAGCIITAVWLVIGAGLPDRAGSHLGEYAPAFQIVNISNQAVSLPSLRGQPIIINFWATWCGPCVIETPLLQAAFADHASAGLRIIGVDSGERLSDVANWKSRFGITYDLVIDGTGQISNLYHVPGLPTTYFIARDGTVQQIVNGLITASQMQAEVSRLLR